MVVKSLSGLRDLADSEPRVAAENRGPSQAVGIPPPQGNAMLHTSPGQRPGFIAMKSTLQAEGLLYIVPPCHNP